MLICLRQFFSQRAMTLAVVAFCSFTMAAPAMHAANSDDEIDNYRLRIDGFWFYSNPSGTFQGAGSADVIDINKDLHFNSYSTGSAFIDWKFTHKNHLTFAVSPFQQSRALVLDRTIQYQGQTYNVGATINANLQANLYAPGYEYDIIRRRRGHIGVGVQIDLFDAKASLAANAQVTGGGNLQPAAYGSASLLAPIPVAGPQYRLYLTNSSRLFIEGNLYGMYLFGYGDFLSTTNTLGLTIQKHLSVNAGYSLGSRLVVNDNSTTRLGVHLIQQGVLVGLEASF